MTWETKASLLSRGIDLMAAFCEENELHQPPVVTYKPATWQFPHTCAYYRPGEIHICVGKTAAIGYAGMSWSFPGHSVDRTPYGVIAHELGHHVDMERSTRKDRYRGDFSITMRQRSGHEQPLTSYCPDDGEWFAEMFRLFVTNPDLLRVLRPKTTPRCSITSTPCTPTPGASGCRARRTGPSCRSSARSRRRRSRPRPRAASRPHCCDRTGPP